jgi:hypothetical protein
VLARPALGALSINAVTEREITRALIILTEKGLAESSVVIGSFTWGTAIEAGICSLMIAAACGLVALPDRPVRREIICGTRAEV